MHKKYSKAIKFCILFKHVQCICICIHLYFGYLLPIADRKPANIIHLCAEESFFDICINIKEGKR